MKLGKRQLEVLHTIHFRGFWCYSMGFRAAKDADTQRVCEALEKKGLLESFERDHPLGFAKTTAWRICQGVDVSQYLKLDPEEP